VTHAEEEHQRRVNGYKTEFHPKMEGEGGKERERRGHVRHELAGWESWGKRYGRGEEREKGGGTLKVQNCRLRHRPERGGGGGGRKIRESIGAGTAALGHAEVVGGGD